MNVVGFFRWAVKKPVIIIVVLVCALIGGIQGYRSTSTHYETSGAVLVIPPGAGNQNAGMNPFVNLTTGTAQLAFVLATATQSEDARAAVAKTGASPDFQIQSVAGEGSFAQLSSQITFTVAGPDPWIAKAGAVALIDFMRDRLRIIQRDAGVTEGTYADLRVPTEAAPGVAVGGNAIRSAVGFAMGGALGALLLCLIAAAALEAWRKHRAKGARSEQDAGNADAAPQGAARADATQLQMHPPHVQTQTRETAEPPSGPLAGIITGAPSSPLPEVPEVVTRKLAAVGRAQSPVAIRRIANGSAAQRAMTRWRDHVEEVPEESEFPLPVIDDSDVEDDDAPRSRTV